MKVEPLALNKIMMDPPNLSPDPNSPTPNPESLTLTVSPAPLPAGLLASESVLQFIKRTQKAKGTSGSNPSAKGLTNTERMKAAFVEGEGVGVTKAKAVTDGKGGKRSFSVDQIRKQSKSSNPFELLMGL